MVVSSVMLMLYTVKGVCFYEYNNDFISLFACYLHVDLLWRIQCVFALSGLTATVKE